MRCPPQPCRQGQRPSKLRPINGVKAVKRHEKSTETKHLSIPSSFTFELALWEVDLGTGLVSSGAFTRWESFDPPCRNQPSVTTEESPVVFVIDPDVSIRDALRRLIRSVGLRVDCFDSPLEFLLEERPDAPSCLVLEVRLPAKSGLDFQRELAEADVPLPIIFVTGYGDIAMTVRAMKAGAVDFLTKPFREQDVLDAIHAALGRDRARRRRQAEMAMLRERLESLTPRESEVLPLIVSGLPNKQVAAEIGTTETTVKAHRSQIMKKMGAESLPELVRTAQKIGISASNR